MPIIISDEILSQTNLTEGELRLEIAIALYKKSKFSIGQAAKFSDISIFKMHEVLSEQNVPLNISSKEVVNDWDTIRNLKSPRLDVLQISTNEQT